MINALGQPQTVLAARRHQRHRAGGRRGLGPRPGRPHVVLAARPGPRRDAAAAARWGRSGCDGRGRSTSTPRRTDTHPALIAALARERDIDVALVAFGVLGDEEQAWQDHAAAIQLARVNYTGAGQRRRLPRRAWCAGRATA